MRSWVYPCIFVILLTSIKTPAQAQQTFKSGSLIIPMDTTYQDNGMLRAYGLIYYLLKNEVPVCWVIKAQKVSGDADLTTSSKDFKTGALIPSHGYRGGPFVIEAAYATKAKSFIESWQAKNTTTVHIAQTEFNARSARQLVAAPSIAVIADGNEDIAFKYLNAAGIPDRLGNVWSKTSPDVLTISEVAGVSSTLHNDGALFRPSGQPAYCQIMTMHWGVDKVVDEVVAEYRSFLQFPTHMMAECQAVNAIENNIYGHFITPNGFLIDNNIKEDGPFSLLNQDTPFAQMDGAFQLVGGSERAYSLPPGDEFYDMNVVMIKDASTALGTRSIWMTGYIDGKCSLIEGVSCSAGVGKVSYLGGHQYDVALPISTHPSTQGTRLFLNSLFEASCASSEAQPLVILNKEAPTWTTSGTVTYNLHYANIGAFPALDLVLTDVLSSGVKFVSSDPPATVNGSTLTWTIGDFPAQAANKIQLTVSFNSYGSYINSFSATYSIGLNRKTIESNAVTTFYQATLPADSGPPTKDGGLMPLDSKTMDGTTSPNDAAQDCAISHDLTALKDGPQQSVDQNSADTIFLRDLTGVDWIVTKADGMTSQMDGTIRMDSILLDNAMDKKPPTDGIPDAMTPVGAGAESSGCSCSIGYENGPNSPWILLLFTILGLRYYWRRVRFRRISPNR